MTFHPFFIYLNAYFTAFQLINLKIFDYLLQIFDIFFDVAIFVDR